MKKYTSKNLFRVYTNDKQHIVVKSSIDVLEAMVQNNLIREYTSLTVYNYMKEV